MAPALFSEAVLNTTAGIHGFLAAEILQFSRSPINPGRLLDLCRRIHRESKRSAYMLERLAWRTIQQTAEDDPHE